MNKSMFLIAATVLVLPCLAVAQAGSGQQEGISSGGYTIHQSIEAGYRYTDRVGSEAMYGTLVDLQSGPRILQQTLSMQSETHESLFFDNLYVNSFGWGGDPENVLRARIDKNKWYNFNANFRRDYNFFDFNLLANPLNPATASPATPVETSPHDTYTRRRMTDVDLTLLPQSQVTFRLGFSHNNMNGPSYTSFHEGTDVLLYQPWNTTMNTYRMGVDWKLLPRTVLSYDQSFDYYKGDTSWQLGSALSALLPGGAGSVELGLPVDTVSRIPCAIPSGSTSLIDDTGTLTNVACNGYFDYARTQPIRTSTPTERLSLRSNYFKRVDFSAAFAYSEADMSTPYSEFFNGLVSRTRTRQFDITGPAAANRISNVLDASATVHLTDHIRLVDTFYYWAYRIPSSFDSTETAYVIAGSGTCAAPTCSLLIPLTGITPTVTSALDQFSFDQKWKRNQVDLNWDMNKRFGVRIGYRYGDKVFDHFLDYTSGDFDHIPIHENTGLFGLWVKPVQGWRMNFDMERVYNDNTLIRIGARKENRYRFQTSYAPRPWAVLGGSFNLMETANPDTLTDFRGHNRNFGFNASLAPRDRWSVDVAYNYNDYLQNSLICFNDTPPAGVTLPVVTTAGSCAAYDSANPLQTDSYYINNTHFVSALFSMKPVKRVTTRFGYSLTNVDGKTPQFNYLQPDGTLRYRYNQPLADFSLDLGHNLSWNAGYNYYQYNERSFTGPTAPRYMHANLATVALHYEF